MTQPYPILAFFQPVANFPALVSMGINTVCGPEIEGGSSVTADQWCTAANKAGLNVILKLPANLIGMPPSNCVGTMLSADEPNEPKGNKPPIPASALRDEYNRLKSLALPVYLSLGGDKVVYDNFPNTVDKSIYLDYASVCDVLMVNFYSANRNASRYTPAMTARAVENLVKLTGKPVYAWLECNDQQLSPPKLPDVNRAPTPGEITTAANLCRTAGATGIGWFFTCGAGKYGWPASYLPMVDRAGNSMQPQYDMVKAINLGFNPPPPPPGPTLQQQVDQLKTVVDAHSQVLAAIGKILAVPQQP